LAPFWPMIASDVSSAYDIDLMGYALPVPARRETTPILSVWADMLVAAACASQVPGAAHLLPLVPLLLFAPRIADRLGNAWPRNQAAQFVPDPHAPDWAQLARGLAAICQQVEIEGRSHTLRLAPFYNPDASPRPYLLEVLPQRRVLRIREPSAPRPHEYRLPFPLRLKLPQPLLVGDRAATLRVAPLPGFSRHSQFSLSQRQPDPFAQSAFFLLGLPLLLLPAGWRWSLAAALALLTPPLSRLIAGGDWRPFRRDPALSRSPASLAFDLLRLWVGALALVRWAVPGSFPGGALQDALAFLFWSLMLPCLLQAGILRIRQWRQIRARKPS
jgi:hypothetical protein